MAIPATGQRKAVRRGERCPNESVIGRYLSVRAKFKNQAHLSNNSQQAKVATMTSLSVSSSPSSLDATISLSSSSDSMSSKSHSREASACIVRQRRLVIVSLFIAAFMALTEYSYQLHQWASLAEDEASFRSLYQSSISRPNYRNDIVMNIYNDTFAHLQDCPVNIPIDDCLTETFNSLDESSPWWFHSMLRDSVKIVSARHHHLSAPTKQGPGLQFCSIGKIGTKQWRRLICRLQHKPSSNGRNVCRPDTPIPQDAPKAVFLRDPLERFLSAYMDKCDSWHIVEKHCEPLAVFLEQENNTMTKGLDRNKKIMFETYVNTIPLQWNTHFLPQRYD